MSSCLQDSILSQTLTLQSITDWINETNKSEEVSLGSDSSFISFLKSLKDGVALCKLVSKLKGRFIMFNKNPRNMEFMEQENFETFIKTQLITQASMSNSSVSQLNGKETHKLCAQPDSNCATSPLALSLMRVLIQLSESVAGKASYRGPVLIIGSDSVTFVRGSTSTSVTTTSTRTTSPEESKQVINSPESNDVTTFKSNLVGEKKVFKENIEPEVAKKYELLTKEDIDSVLKVYRNEQMEAIKQQLEKFRKTEEEKINRELKQMRQNMINQLQREQRDFEMDMKRQAQELLEKEKANISTKPPPVSKTVVTREKRISIELPKNEPVEPKKVVEEGSSAAIQKKLEETTEKLIATEVKYEKLLDDLKEQLSKKKKEVERLEEENMLLAKRLKKLKNIKLNDGLEELDKEDVTSKSIRSLHTLLANSGDDDDDVPNFSHPSNSSSSTRSATEPSHSVLKTRETLPSVRFLSPSLKKSNSSDVHEDNALIDEHSIQVEEPSLLSMSDDEDDHQLHQEEDEEPIVFQTAVLKKVPSNVHRLAQPIRSSFDTDEELFESSYSDLNKSETKKKNNKQLPAKKSIFNSDIQ
ncbi:hypothetical protein FDP41_012768 [Naegleria fowleri]|uniref:Calponin-homology (CH) domain-containing protein n=1 Tax=Naegleria fowleri TaxID=5763 RepID=A0A6A5C551_NAEFO|nr:uncharacterized protein FDP41_012768 [Naegleria fowleri]KAF0980980.1 hypothetical protein FDP41_012768 [Naegleria fowleri]